MNAALASYPPGLARTAFMHYDVKGHNALKHCAALKGLRSNVSHGPKAIANTCYITGGQWGKEDVNYCTVKECQGQPWGRMTHVLRSSYKLWLH